MTYEEAMRWMHVHGRDIEALSAEGDAMARPVSYRFTELLMDPHSVRAQLRLAEAVGRYHAAHSERAVPQAGAQRKTLSQQVLDDICAEEDARACAEMLRGTEGGDPEGAS
jgi:hypothetical protein